MARSTFRSVTYDLDSSLALAGAVAASPGRAVASEELAVSLGYSGARNGAFLTRLANARLFGLVSGASDRISLTDRGRRALGTDPETAGPARVEAFLAVPLYRAVLERSGGGVVPSVGELGALLQREFGEPERKARATAAKLLDSARQAGLVQTHETSLTGRFAAVTDFTDFTAYPRPALSTHLSSPSEGRGTQGDSPVAGRARSARGASEVGDVSSESTWSGPSDETEGLWLDEAEGTRRPHGSLRRRVTVAVAAAVCVAVIAVPLAYAATGSSTTTAKPPVKNGNPTQVVNGQAAVAQVVSALGATTAAGNFSFTYTLDGTAPTNPTPTTTTTQPCSATSSSATVVPSGAPVGGANDPAPLPMGVSPAGGFSGGGSFCTSGSGNSSTLYNVSVTGGGTIDVNPTAMTTTADVGSGLNVDVRVDNTNYWEESGGSAASLTPPPGEGAGSPLSSFAGLVDGTLGNREGGVAMLGMASPSGYLDLDQQQVTSAGVVGTGSVAGAPVTIYQVNVSPAQEAQVAGASPEEMTTITNALATLKNEGFTGTTVRLSVDGEGYIREADTTAHFADGGTAVLDVTLSDFGCAGTVLTPGQQGSGVPPAGCTSPVPSTTTTTTAPAPAIAPVPTTTPTTVGHAPTTTSTTSTTSTTVPTSTTLVVPPNSTVPSSPPPST